MDDLTRATVAAASGDRVALTAWVRATQPEVWRLCARLGDLRSADDLTQEVYLRAIPALARFRGEASGRTWLLQIARNVCADHVRRSRRGRALVERITQRTRPGPEPGRDGEVDLDHLVRALDPARREAFVLTQVLGLSYAEAAEACDVPIGTIRSRVARARADLVAMLDEDRAATGG
ncbi:MAG: sigma-70 family RNA polymerase sigma factor [Acidimicrobiia bacterium]